MFLFFCNIYLGGRFKMIKIAKELNKVIESLEDSGKYVEAKELHNVFIKVAQMGSVPGYQGTMGTTGNYQAPQNQTVVQQQQAQLAPKGYKGNPQNYQRLITEYRNRLYQEAKTSTDSRLPQTSDFYKQIMIGNELTDQEKQAFRAQAFKIRQEGQLTAYGTKQPQKGQFNLPLMIENLMKQSGVMQMTDPQKLENSKMQLFKTISQQISQNVPQQQQQQYLQYANNILGTYLNNRRATLAVPGQQPGLAQQPGAQQSPTISPM
jgi:hypothetical protein